MPALDKVTLDKVLDRIPIASGGFRRRMTAGITVSVTMSVAISVSGDIDLTELIGLIDREILFGPGVFVVLILVHSIGGIIEVFSELFVARIAGNIAWSFESSKTRASRVARASWVTRVLRPILVWVIGWPRRVGKGICLAMFGKSLYVWENRGAQLSDLGCKKVKEYPQSVQDSLDHPFGRRRSLIWTYFKDCRNSDVTMRAARRLDVRNHDLLCIITSLMLSGVILVLPYLLNLLESKYPGLLFWIFFGFMLLLVLGIFMVSLSILLYGYIMLLRQSIVMIIEVDAIQSANPELTRNSPN